MFTKINNQLLSKYPLLWNTRIVNVLAAAIITHILFYTGGLLQYVDAGDLSYRRIFNTEEVGLFSGLVTAVFIIVWLVHYFRNNAFKSFYIISRNYLFYEFMLIFLVFLSTATFYLTYNQGIYDSVRLKTSGTNLTREANTINLASHFIASDPYYFSSSNICSEKTGHQGYSERYPSEAPQQEKLSYLNYCYQQISFDDDKRLLSAKQIHDIGNQWLLQGKKDSVRAVLVELLSLCDKYNIQYRFNPDAQISEVFSDERHTVNHFVPAHYDPNSPVYISVSELIYTVNHIKDAHQGFWKKEIVFFILYYALCAALVVFSFRLTRTKPWFVALVGLGVLAIIVSLIAVTVRAGDNFAAFPLTLWVLFIFVTLLWIFNRENKLFAGVTFNWVMWFTPAVIPIVFYLIYENTGFDYSLDNHMDYETPIHKWIRQNWNIINTINLLALVAAVYLAYIPLARKWQSNPEE